MSRMKRGLLIALCLLSCLLLTGCYSDNDPWPSADQLGGSQAAAQPDANAVPATDVPATQPPATPEPLPEDAVDASPNFNG